MNGVMKNGAKSGQGLSSSYPTEEQVGPVVIMLRLKETGGESNLKKLVDL